MMAVPGYFGKFPHLGDFVTRRLPANFVDPWDEWLQSVLHSSKEKLGDSWLDLFLTSPVWNFVVSNQLCGDHSWAGVIMPSVDRVGRYFPLTIATQLSINSNPLQVASGNNEWFVKADSVILSALNEQGIDLEEFDNEVTALGALDDKGLGGSMSDVGFGTAWQLPLSENGTVNQLLPMLAHQMLSQRLGEYSLWWTAGSHQVSSSLLLCSGLPDERKYNAMLCGDWEQNGWEIWPGSEYCSAM